MKRFSDEWWIELMAEQAELAYKFNEDTLVFSEMAVRAIVVKALSDASDSNVSTDAQSKLQEGK